MKVDIVTLVCIAVVMIGFSVLCAKDYYNRNRNEKQRLTDQIEQCQNTIRENKEKAEDEAKKYERARISRDINLALGYTSDKLVDIIIEYCPCKLMSAKSLCDMKTQIAEAKDDYNFDNLLKEKYLPIIGRADFWIYHYKLQMLKSIIRLHKELTPQDVIEQINFYRQNNSCNINDLDLYSCVKSINLHLEPHNEFAFFTNDEVRKIAKLITERFNFGDVVIEGVLHPSDHSSYHRSISGISQIFARSLFNSKDVYSQLSFLDENIFLDTVEQYFFYEVCYDIKYFRSFLPEIIDYVKEHRNFAY